MVAGHKVIAEADLCFRITCKVVVVSGHKVMAEPDLCFQITW
jgi:hypothetical protein